MAGRIEVVVGDITRLEVDAIVNAANRSLEVAVGAVREFMKRHALPGRVIFCCFDERTAAIFRAALANPAAAAPK